MLGKEFGKMENAHDMARRIRWAGRSFDLVQKMLGVRTTENGTKTDDLLQARASGHKRAWQNVETNSGSLRWQDTCQGGKKLED